MGLTMDLMEENERLVDINEAQQVRIVELAKQAKQYMDEVEALKRLEAGLREMLHRQNKEITRMKKVARNG